MQDIIMIGLLAVLVCLTVGIFVFFSARLNEGKRASSLAQGQIQQLLGEVQRFQERSEGLRTSLDTIQRDFSEELSRNRETVSALQERLEQGTGFQELIKSDLTEAKSALQKLSEENTDKSAAQDGIRKSLSVLEHLMRDSSPGGASGENILYQALSSFPRDMINLNCRINEKMVELALRMPGGKLLPIHSKFRDADLLSQLEGSPDSDQRRDLLSRTESYVGTLIREVSSFINTAQTEPMAILALPDSVYALLQKAHFDAFRHKVVLMSYSLSLPYLLTLLNLHNQMAGRKSIREITGQLGRVSLIVDRIGQTLDSQMAKAVTQLSNSHQTARGLAGDLRAIVSQLTTGYESDGGGLKEGGDTSESWAVPER
jgi:DNA recombination protein RmuC